MRLEDRFEKIDDRLAKLELDVAAIKAGMANYATKADLHEMSASLIKWTVGTAVALGAVAITVMTFVLNHAVPGATPSHQAPVIINVPTPQQTPPPLRP